MIKEFFVLTEEERNVIMDTPALITILIAGADGKIDEKEKEWAYKVKVFRSSKEDSRLSSYFTEVGGIFKDRLEELIDELPDNIGERNSKITSELEKLNNIFPKLDKTYAVEFYKNMLSYAEQIAKASGGVLGFSPISPEERKWLGLEFIKDPSL